MKNASYKESIAQKWTGKTKPYILKLTYLHETIHQKDGNLQETVSLIQLPRWVPMVLVCLRLKYGAQVNLQSHSQVNQRSQSNMNYVIDEFQVAKTHAVKTQIVAKKSAAETVNQRAG